MISQNDGEALQSFMQSDPGIRVRLQLEPVRYAFEVKETLLCEHVGLRVDTDHSRRRDVRITLISPMGTRSVLQQVNSDNLAGPVNWTYYSVQHFYESSAGMWTVEISDEDDTGVGEVKSVSLIVRGVPITDLDRDGLSDPWEQQYFGSLTHGPLDDPDGDGFNNSREQVMGGNPNSTDRPFQLDLSVWDERLVRLSWPGLTNAAYQVRAALNPIAPLTNVTNVPGSFPETEWFVPLTDAIARFFRVGTVPR
jgi:subtilisin-like proprotein convertase family protein